LITALDVLIPAAPAAGQVTEQAIVLEAAEGPRFHLISVHYVGPQPPAGGVMANAFTWTRRAMLFKPTPASSPLHVHSILIQNPNTVAITVACRAYRLIEE
jgi:hypothetical protein